MTQPTLLILAAGMGSRYGGFKQIDPIGPAGEIIIDYSIYDAFRAGFGKIVVLTRPEIEAPLRAHFQQTLGDRKDVVFAYQNLDDLPEGFTLPAGRQKPWGTAHAIWAARHQLDTAFGVINADDFYGPSSFQILHDALLSKTPGDCCMVGFELAKTLSRHGSVSRGICRCDANGCLSDVTEHTQIEPDGPHGARSLDAGGNWQPIAADSITSMNLWGFDPDIHRHLETEFRAFLACQGADLKSEFYIPSAVNTLITTGGRRCKVFKTPEQWFGMTYKEDRELAVQAVRELIAAKVYPETLRPSA
ncbi:MAG: nucleotidyltransferase [Verrucomicrobia bacterium]|nr:nucleotidyltransferase [Verrucomicrobiota bacterium]